MNKDARYTPEGRRLCDDTKCPNEATHTCVWTDKWQFYCFEHANKMVAIGNLLGFGAPMASLRALTEEEKTLHDNTP